MLHACSRQRWLHRSLPRISGASVELEPGALTQGRASWHLCKRPGCSFANGSPPL